MPVRVGRYLYLVSTVLTGTSTLGRVHVASSEALPEQNRSKARDVEQGSGYSTCCSGRAEWMRASLPGRS